MLRLFTFTEAGGSPGAVAAMIDEKSLPDEKAAITVLNVSRAQLEDINTRHHKFQRQLRRLIEGTTSDPDGVAVLKERCARAIEYFTGQIATQLVAPLREHIDHDRPQEENEALRAPLTEDPRRADGAKSRGCYGARLSQ